MKKFSWILLVFLIVVIFALFFNANRNSQKALYGFSTNEAFIEGLYQDINLSDDLTVFQYVFKSLPDEVTVYPTENYYYFKFSAHGTVIGGTLHLSAYNRDEGIIGFGYVERNDDVSVKESILQKGGGRNFGKKDGLELKRFDNFTYIAQYKGKKVNFKLYNPGLILPVRANLTKDEQYVGPVFDESGLKFHLIYNKNVSQFYYILNEDYFVPEKLTLDKSGLFIGERTQFVFFDDYPNNRKILIGVKGENVLRNNWYDGPFDQLPDNYIYSGQIVIRPLIEASYPSTKGRISDYGYYQDQNGSRVAIAPYTVYFSFDDLLNVQDECASQSTLSSEFYKCITTQHYTIPPDYFYN
jgi:hypothetical protein